MPLAIAILVEATLCTAGWMLRIRGELGAAVILGLLAPAIAVLGWIFVKHFRDPEDRRRAMPRDPWLALIVVASIAVVPLGGFTDTRLAYFLLVIPVILLQEELFCRGIVQAAAERVMHPLAAIVVGNVAFIAIHAPVIEINALSISIVGGGGFVIGVVYQVTRSLGLAWVVHLLGDWALLLPAPALLGNDALIAANALIAAAAAWWWWSARGKGIAR